MSDNKDMRPSGTPKQLEQHRRNAIALLEQGHKAQEVDRLVGANPGTLCDWKKAYQELGEAFLKLTARRDASPGCRTSR